MSTTNHGSPIPAPSAAPTAPTRCPECGSTMVRDILVRHEPAKECMRCGHWGTLAWGFQQQPVAPAPERATPTDAWQGEGETFIPTAARRAGDATTESQYAQGSHLFNHEHLWRAYTTGANDASKHAGHVTDELIARSADAYVKSVAPLAVSPPSASASAGADAEQNPQTERERYLVNRIRAASAVADEYDRQLDAALSARQEVKREPVACGVCLGQPLASGKKCICGGIGTEQAEMQGLREALFDAESARQEVERELAAAKAAHERTYRAWEAERERLESDLAATSAALLEAEMTLRPTPRDGQQDGGA
jgi:hypothetical protein